MRGKMLNIAPCGYVVVEMPVLLLSLKSSFLSISTGQLDETLRWVECWCVPPWGQSVFLTSFWEILNLLSFPPDITSAKGPTACMSSTRSWKSSGSTPRPPTVGAWHTWGPSPNDGSREISTSTTNSWACIQRWVDRLKINVQKLIFVMAWEFCGSSRRHLYMWWWKLILYIFFSVPCSWFCSSAPRGRRVPLRRGRCWARNWRRRWGRKIKSNIWKIIQNIFYLRSHHHHFALSFFPGFLIFNLLPPILGRIRFGPVNGVGHQPEVMDLTDEPSGEDGGGAAGGNSNSTELSCITDNSHCACDCHDRYGTQEKHCFFCGTKVSSALPHFSQLV